MHSPTRKCFISRTYLTLSELRDEWNTTDEHIRYLIENRKLRAYLRPALVFYTNNNVDYLNDYDPLPISHPDLCRLLRDREACIRIIEAHFNARYDDIVIKDSDRCMVEEEYPHLISSGIWPLVLYSENWTCFEYKKRRYTFGHTQGAVLKYLYQQLRSGKPLVGTKELLNAVNAHCHHIANLFNHKPEWKNLIIFPERGYCRLNMPDKIIAQKYQPSLFDNIDE